MPQTGLVLVALGQLALEQGDTRQARARWRQGLDLAAALGHRHLLASVFEGAAAVLVRESAASPEEAVQAVQLVGAARQLRLSASMAVSDDTLATQALDRAEAIFGRGKRERHLVEGQSMALEAAAEIARRALDDQVDAPHDAGADGLTRREREVAALLARGLTNRQIAEQLVIAERTAEMHVSNVLGKLGVSTRAQAAVWASAHCDEAMPSSR